jgi:hypothetical protein
MDRLRQGTPKTLRQAIDNGFADETRGEFTLEGRVENHVIDFLAQKFSPYILEGKPGFSELFEKITGRKVGQR